MWIQSPTTDSLRFVERVIGLLLFLIFISQETELYHVADWFRIIFRSNLVRYHLRPSGLGQRG